MMDHAMDGSETRFEAYVKGLSDVIGHAGRSEPLHDYCAGLMMPIKRKSVEPMAAVIAPSRVSAKHQSLLHFVGQSPWSDDAVLSKVRELVLPSVTASGPIRAWIIDDTGIPKKGRHSVGVARQYCGQLGKQDNCQTAVSLSLAGDAASLPIAYRLYLPKVWAHDAERRKKARVPEDIVFKTKPEIALEQIKAAHDAGLPPGVVLSDSGYGNSTELRSAVTALGLTYVMGVLSTISVWPPGTGPLPPLSPEPTSGDGGKSEAKRRGRPRTRLRRDADHQPVSAQDLAMSLGEDAWQTITWREGTNTKLSSRFAAIRVRPARRDHTLNEPRSLEWLLIEWPSNEAEPTKFWLSTLDEETTLDELVDLAKLRWRIERDYQDLKQEIGLGHYEGRGWRGFHHHATLAIAAYGYLICEAQAIPPSGPGRFGARQMARLPEGYRPRGTPDPTRTPRGHIDHDSSKASHRQSGAQFPSMSLLQQDTR